jgi:hypothetical protein
MIMQFILLIFCLVYPLAFCGSFADGRDLFVSSSGSDSGSGTLQDPLKTPHRAAQIAGAGDVIYLRQGVYRPPENRSPINFSQAGTPDAPVRMTAYAGETAVLSGMRDLSDPQSWRHHEGKIYHSTEPQPGLVHLIVQDDRFLEPKEDLDSLQEPGQWYFDAEKERVYLWSFDGENPARHRTEIGLANTIILFDAQDTHFLIENLTITGASYGIRCLPGGGNRVFRKLVFRHFTEDAVKFHTAGNHDDVVESCSFSSCGDFGIDTYGSSTQSFRYNRFSAVHAWKSGGAIKSLAGGSNHTIEGNMIYKLGGLGHEAAIELRETNRTLIVNNVIAAVNGGGISLYAKEKGLSSPVPDPATYQIKIINNTIYHTKRSAIRLEDKSSEITIKNNIINQLPPDGACIRVEPGNEAGFQSDFNLIVHPFRPPIRWLDKEYSLDQFRRQAGNDSHSLSADPLFRNAAAFDFRLKSGSPAIDSGDTSSVPERDGDRRPRVHGRSVDIGAYEFTPARP